MPADPKQSELLAGAKRGDEGAWNAIVSQLGPKLQGYARAKGVPDPEDLMQEVFLAASRRIYSFEGSWDNFRSWLFTIAFRRVADAHRRAGRSPALVPIEAKVGASDESQTPENHFLAQEQLRETLQALDTLSPLEREVVLLRIVGELDSDEVGRIVGKRAGTIRVIQSRAVQKIKQAVREPLTTQQNRAEEHHVVTRPAPEGHAVAVNARKKHVTNSSPRRLRG
jgi:RNA polymerase sigma-70 factor (ECF subfamily)